MGFITNFIEGFNSVGNPSITYFNGTITRNQLITIIVVILVCLLLLKLVKKGIKLVVFLCACFIIFFNISNFSPSKLATSSEVMSSIELKEQLVSLADKSDRIKIDGTDISVKVNDTWINVNDIKSLVDLKEGKISLNIDGEDIIIDDDKIIELLNIFTNIT